VLWAGGLIVLVTVVAIIRRQDSRLTLMLAGSLMAILAGKPMVVVDAFVDAMIHKSFVPIICIVMGFVFVLKLTKCDEHLIHALSGSIGRFPRLLIPSATIITFLMCIPLTSAAAVSAAVGAVLIPLLIANQIHPAMAASAVFAGSWGSMFSPGSAHLPVIARLANTDIVSVMNDHAVATLVSMVIVVAGLMITARIRHEDGRDYRGANSKAVKSSDKFKVNYFKALVPVVPLGLLLLGSKQISLIPRLFSSVPLAMMLGVVVCFIVTCQKPADISRQFFAGMGEAYNNIIGIIIAAYVFTAGMSAIGLTDALIDVMKGAQAMAKISATFGPFIIAVLSGSGDAATMAFNTSVTPYAADFGLGISQLGSQAFLAGGLGRSMSPVAGVAIICAGMAGVNPFELSCRNALPMILAAIVGMFILL